MIENNEAKMIGGDEEDSFAGASTQLSINQYPELQGIKKGTTIKGTFEALVDSIDSDMANLSFSSINLETENQADKEMRRMTNQPEQARVSYVEEEE